MQSYVLALPHVILATNSVPIVIIDLLTVLKCKVAESSIFILPTYLNFLAFVAS